jgi:hypothetical protein
MSRRLLVFLLSELATVRIICKNCHAIFELPIEKLGMRLQSPTCKVCNHDLLPPFADENAFGLLARAVSKLKDQAATVEVEFVLPDVEGEK